MTHGPAGRSREAQATSPASISGASSSRWSAGLSCCGFTRLWSRDLEPLGSRSTGLGRAGRARRRAAGEHRRRLDPRALSPVWQAHFQPRGDARPSVTMLRGAAYFFMIRLRGFSASALSRFAVATASKTSP